MECSSTHVSPPHGDMVRLVERAERRGCAGVKVKCDGAQTGTFRALRAATPLRRGPVQRVRLYTMQLSSVMCRSAGLRPGVPSVSKMFIRVSGPFIT